MESNDFVTKRDHVQTPEARDTTIEYNKTVTHQKGRGRDESELAH